MLKVAWNAHFRWFSMLFVKETAKCKSCNKAEKWNLESRTVKSNFMEKS